MCLYIVYERCQRNLFDGFLKKIEDCCCCFSFLVDCPPSLYKGYLIWYNVHRCHSYGGRLMACLW